MKCIFVCVYVQTAKGLSFIAQLQNQLSVLWFSKVLSGHINLHFCVPLRNEHYVDLIITHVWVVMIVIGVATATQCSSFDTLYYLTRDAFSCIQADILGFCQSQIN